MLRAGVPSWLHPSLSFYGSLSANTSSSPGSQASGLQACEGPASPSVLSQFILSQLLSAGDAAVSHLEKADRSGVNPIQPLCLSHRWLVGDILPPSGMRGERDSAKQHADPSSSSSASFQRISLMVKKEAFILPFPKVVGRLQCS